MFLPARPLPLKALWPGILVTMIMWLAAAIGYSIYLAIVCLFRQPLYRIGWCVATLTFLYISAAIFQFGGEINRAMFAKRNRSKETPTIQRLWSR